MSMKVQAVQQTIAIIKYTNMFILYGEQIWVVYDSWSFLCYIDMNLNNKQISIYTAKLNQKAISKLTLLHRTYTNTTYFISCVIARTKLHRPFAGTFWIP